MNKQYLARWLCALLIAVESCAASAGDLFDEFETHGFVTQGFIKTSANSFFGDSEDGSFDFTEIGINAAFQPFDNVRVSGQLLSRRAGEMYDGVPDFDFLLADISLITSSSHALNVIAGRVKNPLGIFNETRDVAFTRPSVFLPQSVYYQVVRSLALSADGIAVRARSFVEHGNFELQFGLGKSIVDENVEIAYLGPALSGSLDSARGSWVGRFMFESVNERFRMAVSAASTSLDFDSDEGAPFADGNIDIFFGIVSLQYQLDELILTSEFVREPIKYKGFAGLPIAEFDSTLEGYYLLAQWHVNEKLELHARYEHGYLDKSDKSGDVFASLFGLPAHTRYFESFAVGFRWKLSRNFMIQSEYQWNKGTLILSKKENPDPLQLKPDWDLFALSVSYRF